MEMVLLIVSAVSAISIAAIAVLLLQIKKSLNTTKTEQEQLLKLVESANELSKQLGQITAEGNRKQTEYSETVNNQVGSLVQETSKLENHLVKLLESDNNFKETFFQQMQGNTEKQLENLQALVEKIDAFTPVQNQAEILIRSTSNLENRLTQLVEASNSSSVNIANLVQNNANKQVENLQALVEKFEAFAPVSKQVGSLIQGTSNLENSLKQLLEASNISTESIAHLLHGNTEKQLENLQALVEKVETFVSVFNQIEYLLQASSNLENRLNQLLEFNSISSENVSNLLQGNTEKQLEALQALVDKIEVFAPVNNQVESLIQGTANLENRLNHLLEANNNFQDNLTNLVQANTEVQADTQPDTQLEKLQVLVDKIEELESVKTQVENLVQGTSNLENRLNQLLETNNTSQENIANFVQSNKLAELGTQLEKLQALVDKFEGFETVKTQVENLVKGTSNLENRLTQLQPSHKPKSKR
jgi:hypothetical protein